MFSRFDGKKQNTTTLSTPSRGTTYCESTSKEDLARIVSRGQPCTNSAPQPSVCLQGSAYIADISSVEHSSVNHDGDVVKVPVSLFCVLANVVGR